MMKQNTAVRIKKSDLLSERFELPNGGLDRILSSYQRAWHKDEQRIIDGLEQVTELTFAQNFIDVYVVNPQSRDMISNPMIIGGGYKPNEFVHILTHALIHRLTCDNTQQVNWHDLAQDILSREDPSVANHVMTNTVLEALYSEAINNSDKMIWHVKNYRQFPEHEAHGKAWDIVRDRGYETILTRLKKYQDDAQPVAAR